MLLCFWCANIYIIQSLISAFFIVEIMNTVLLCYITQNYVSKNNKQDLKN